MQTNVLTVSSTEGFNQQFKRSYVKTLQKTANVKATDTVTVSDVSFKELPSGFMGVIYTVTPNKDYVKRYLAVPAWKGFADYYVTNGSYTYSSLANALNYEWTDAEGATEFVDDAGWCGNSDIEIDVFIEDFDGEVTLHQEFYTTDESSRTSTSAPEATVTANNDGTISYNVALGEKLVFVAAYYLDMVTFDYTNNDTVISLINNGTISTSYIPDGQTYTVGPLTADKEVLFIFITRTGNCEWGEHSYYKVTVVNGPTEIATSTCENITPHYARLLGYVYKGTDFDDLSFGFAYMKAADTANFNNDNSSYTIIDGVVSGFESPLLLNSWANNLEPATEYAYRAYAKTSSSDESEFSLLGEWKTFKTKEIEPVFYDNGENNITNTSATIWSEIIKGSGDIKSKGFEYKAYGEENFQKVNVIKDSVVELYDYTTYQDVEGIYIEYPMTQLLPGTTYRYRTFVITDADTFYSGVSSFTTKAQQTQSFFFTDDATDITANSATLNAVISTDWLANTVKINSKKFLYRAITDSKYTAVDVTGDNFTCAVKDLQEGMVYYVKAVAQISVSLTGQEDYIKEVSSNEITFRTTGESEIPVVKTDFVNTVAREYATLSGSVTAGSSPVIVKGFEYKIEGADEYENVSVVANPMQYSLNDLESGTSYLVRAYATCNNGTTYYGNTVRFTTKDPYYGYLHMTQQPTDITSNSAVLHAQVPDNWYNWKEDLAELSEDVTATMTFWYKKTTESNYKKAEGVDEGDGNNWSVTIKGLSKGTVYTVYTEFNIFMDGEKQYNTEGSNVKFSTSGSDASESQDIYDILAFATLKPLEVEQTEVVLNGMYYSDVLQNENIYVDKAEFLIKQIDAPTYSSYPATSYGNNYYADVTGLDSGATYSYKIKVTLSYNGFSQPIEGNEVLFTTKSSDLPCEPVTVSIEAEINEGESYAFKGVELTEAGIYKDTLQTYDGCDSIVVLTLKVNAGLYDVENSDNGLSVFPNPANGTVTIASEGDVVIINSLGQVVKQINNLKGIKQTDITDLRSGIYYVRSGNKTKKLIVQ